MVGHGINALSIGIEKYAGAFCRPRSGGDGDRLSELRLQRQRVGRPPAAEPDATTDDRPVTEKTVRLQLKRTNLNNVHEVSDFRAAISFLQGEPGVDPERVGIWGSSNGGGVVTAVAGVDARVKAVVAQVSTPRPGARRAVNIAPANLEDAIVRVRQGQGAEVDGGFSFRSKIDQWSNTRNQDVQAGAWLDQVAATTAVLFLPAGRTS